MKTSSHGSQLLSVSERIYCSLLTLYPADFRQVYSRHMTQMFRDVCRDSYRQGGTAALAQWWAAALFDLLQNVIIERRRRGFNMSKDRFIQLSGWLCIFGGIFFVASSLSQLQPDSEILSGGMVQLSLYALVPGMALVTLGLLGIGLHYWQVMELFGKVALLIAVMGGGIMSLGWLLTLMGSGFWNLFLAGWMIQLAGQTIFGGFAATTHLMPRGNLALLIGSGAPLTLIMLILPGYRGMGQPNWAAFTMLLLIGIGWLLTGWFINNPSAASLPSGSAQPAVRS